MRLALYCGATALLSLGLLSPASLALAAEEGHASAQAKPTSEHVQPAVATTKATHPGVVHKSAVAPKPSLVAKPKDPLTKLHARLVEKLGAVKPPGAKHNGELQVVNHREVADRRVRRGKAHARATHWSYQGSTGPKTWGKLKPEYAKCSSGKRQSPINIRDGIKVQLEPVQFDYSPSSFRVIDNGHTVQINVSGGKFIEVTGRRYELLQLALLNFEWVKLAG